MSGPHCALKCEWVNGGKVHRMTPNPEDTKVFTSLSVVLLCTLFIQYLYPFSIAAQIFTLKL